CRLDLSIPGDLCPHRSRFRSLAVPFRGPSSDRPFPRSCGVEAAIAAILPRKREWSWVDLHAKDTFHIYLIECLGKEKWFRLRQSPSARARGCGRPYLAQICHRFRRPWAERFGTMIASCRSSARGRRNQRHPSKRPRIDEQRSCYGPCDLGRGSLP